MSETVTPVLNTIQDLDNEHIWSEATDQLL